MPGFLSKLFSGGASQLVNTIGDTVDKFTTTKQERMSLDLEMKKADNEYQLEMSKLSLQEKQLVLNEKKMYVGDVADARKNQTAIQTSEDASWLSKNIASLLALGTTLLTIILFYIIIFDVGNITSDENNNKEILFYVLGVFSAILTQIFGYYFGSSSGSKSKEVALKNAAQTGVVKPVLPSN